MPSKCKIWLYAGNSGVCCTTTLKVVKCDNCGQSAGKALNLFQGILNDYTPNPERLKEVEWDDIV